MGRVPDREDQRDESGRDASAGERKDKYQSKDGETAKTGENLPASRKKALDEIEAAANLEKDKKNEENKENAEQRARPAAAERLNRAPLPLSTAGGGRPAAQAAGAGAKGSQITAGSVMGVISFLIMVIGLFFMLKRELGKEGAGGASSNVLNSYRNTDFRIEQIEEYKKKFGYVSINDCKSEPYMNLEDEFNDFVEKNIPICLQKKAGIIDAAGKNILLYGKPGTGKTFFARKLYFMLAMNIQANNIKEKLKLQYLDGSNIDEHVDELYNCNQAAEMYKISPSMVKGMYSGQSELLTRELQNFLEWRQQYVTVLLLMDEADAFLPRKSSGDEGGSNLDRSLVSQWLEWMDGTVNKDTQRLFVIATTNHLSQIEEAMHRRFGKKIGLALPTEDEKKDYVRQFIVPLMKVGVSANNKEQITEDIIKASKSISFNYLSEIRQNIQQIFMAKRKKVEFSEVQTEITKASEKAVENEKKIEEDNRIRKAQNRIVNDTVDNPKTTTGSADSYRYRPRDVDRLIISKQELNEIEKKVSLNDDGEIAEKELKEKVFKHLERFAVAKKKSENIPKDILSRATSPQRRTIRYRKEGEKGDAGDLESSDEGEEEPKSAGLMSRVAGGIKNRIGSFSFPSGFGEYLSGIIASG